MKKLSLVLVFFMLIGIDCFAYNYEIKEFDAGGEEYIYQADADALIIGDGKHFKMYDINGNELTSKWYTRIFPLNYEQTIYKGWGTNIYVTTLEQKENIEKTIPKSNVYVNENFYEKHKQYCIENDYYQLIGNDYVEGKITDAFDLDGKLLYTQLNSKEYTESEKEKFCELNKISLFTTKDNKYSICDVDGNLLTSYLYDDCYMDGSTPGFLKLATNDRALVCNTTTGKWVEADSVEAFTLKFEEGIGFVEKTGDGKYIYYNNHLEKVTDIEFDIFHGEYNTSAVFEKDGKYYGFDVDWQLAYVGDRKIKAVYFGNYVEENKDGLLGLCDKNFNTIIPHEYHDIYWIGENVWIAYDGMEYFIYNRDKKVASGIYHFSAWHNAAQKGTRILTQLFDGSECVFDVEGNILIHSKNTTFNTNGFDLFCKNSEGKIGRIIFKNTNPNIRINGKLLVSDTMARIKNNITLVPIRALAEKTGFEVSFNAEKKEINITKDDKEIKFTLGEKKCYSNGKEITLEAAPEVINNRTLVPLRALSDAFGYDISWDGERRLIEITI